ncbi:MAG: MBL fold metallo-hydrolase [Panacagrimonas sp.]
MKIQILGCSGGVGPRLRTTSILIDDDILIDAGTGVSALSLERMSRIEQVFVTHSHLDHVCGLAFMADNLVGAIDHSIVIRGSTSTIKALRDHVFNWTIWPDFSELPNPRQAVIQFKEYSGRPISIGHQRRLRAFEVEHTVPGVGYAVEGPNGVFAYSGDTLDCASLWRGLNRLPRLDYLMIEIAFPDAQAELGQISGHFTPKVLGSAIQQLKHRPKLLLTHFKPGCERRIRQQARQALAGWDMHFLKSGDCFSL